MRRVAESSMLVAAMAAAGFFVMATIDVVKQQERTLQAVQAYGEESR